MKRLAVIVALALAACGGKTDSQSTTQSDAGSDGAPDAFVHPTPSLPCPDAQPQDGASCSHEGVECEYGNDPRYTCNWIATCGQGTWSVTTTNDPWCPTPPTNPAACPATYNQTGQCTDGEVGVPCQYAEGWCSCIFVGGPPMPDGGGPDTAWMCFDQSSVTPGCPATRPRLGTSCTQTDLQCNYSPCGTPSGLAVQCDAQTFTWTQSFGGVCGGASAK
ncbi:MAG TPA: hypothetical protein VGH28_05725 [Polyangiaceae bacterium]|jgi:hypothetical protein